MYDDNTREISIVFDEWMQTLESEHREKLITYIDSLMMMRGMGEYSAKALLVQLILISDDRYKKSVVKFCA